MLRESAAAFTPGETVHQTPIKTTGAATAAADEDEKLCAWLQQKASLTKRVVDKVLSTKSGSTVPSRRSGEAHSTAAGRWRR